jgi:predicted nuclease of predicted toxin-antitoxin system
VAPRFLIDENLSPHLASHLRDMRGYDAVHVQELALRGAPDTEVFRRALAEGRIVMTNNADDFRELCVPHPVHPGVAFILDAVGRARQLSLGETLAAHIASAPELMGYVFQIDRKAMVRTIKWPAFHRVASFR